MIFSLRCFRINKAPFKFKVTFFSNYRFYKLLVYAFLFVSCIFSVCFFRSLSNENKLKKSIFLKALAKIPADDRLILEDLFQSLIVHFNFGYVLFGNKPMSICHYMNPRISKSEIDYHEFTPCNLKMKNGMECWRKYYKLFNSKKFMFAFFGNPLMDSQIQLILINKQKFTEIVQENLRIFQPIFGKDISAKKLMMKIANADFWEYNVNYEMLGILFGYGVLNSNCFQRRADINPQFYGWKFTLKKLIKVPAPGYASIRDEIQYLANCFRPLKDDKPLDEGYMDLPGFLAITNSKETINLKANLTQQRKKMIKIYRNGKFFEQTMLKYMETS